MLGCNQVSIQKASTSVQVIAPASMQTGHCVPWQVSLKSGNKNQAAKEATTVGVALTINGVSVPGANVYSDSQCRNVITSTTISAGSSSATVYSSYNLISALKLTASTAIATGSASASTSMALSRVSIIAGKPDQWGSKEGIGDLARIDGSRGIATDGTYLYVTAHYSKVIYRINIATRENSFLAGYGQQSGTTDGIGPAARFGDAWGLTVHNGYLYVCDSGNRTIRRIDLSTREVTTYAGTTGVQGFADGTGLAATFTNPLGIVSDGTYLYVSDGTKIRRINPANAQVTTIAGTGVNGTTDGPGASATFSTPTMMSTDGSNLYLAEWSQHIIRKIDLTDVNYPVTTIAGTAGAIGFADANGSAARFSSPHAAHYYAGNLYIPDFGNARVRKLDLSTGDVTTYAGSGITDFRDGTFATAEIARPIDIVEAGGNLYITERWNATIRKLDTTAETITTIVGTGFHSSDYANIDGVGDAARFTYAKSSEFDGTYVYIADCSGNTIRRMHFATREVVTIAGSGVDGFADGVGLAAQFSCPQGLALHNGMLYIADWNHRIRKLDLSTSQVTTVAGDGTGGNVDNVGTAARLNRPVALALTGNKLFVAEYDGKVVREINLTTMMVTTVAGSHAVAGTTDGLGTAARFTTPNGLTVSGNYLYITDNTAVRRMDLSNYDVTTFAGSTTGGYLDGIGSAARFAWLTSVTSDGTSLYVSDTSNYTIRKINIASTEVTTLGGVGPAVYGTANSDNLTNATFYWPLGLIYTPVGIIYSCDGLSYCWIH